MPYFTKKPVKIEARQFINDSSAYDLICWINTFIYEMYGKTVNTPYAYCSNDKILIPTKEGIMEASCGDWIIRGVKGEFYPCKPDIFQLTYEGTE